MVGIHPVLSQEELVEQVLSHKEFYNNTLNVESRIIDPNRGGSDDALLGQLGYKQELKRHFSTFQCFGVAFSIMGLLPSIASIFSQGIVAGPAGFLWGWVISSLLILTIGVAMSISGSSMSTSGGLYYWTNYYSPPRFKTVISYLIGNTNSIALIGGFCSVVYGFALQVYSIVVIAKDGDFEITQPKIYGVFVACVIAQVGVTCLSSKNCAHLQTVSVVANVTIIVIYVIAMLVGARGNYKPASYVFGEWDNLSDWPIGWTQISAAWLPAIWTIGAFDSVIHQSEEVHNAGRVIPIGILGSITACGSLGTVIIIVTLFCIQTNDIEGHILGSKFGQPLAQIIYDVLGKKWALFFMVFMSICQFLMASSILTAISRQIWAFSRDNGLPFSFWVKRVHKELSTPINAVIFGGVGAIIMGLLVLIGVVAANALFSLYIAGNYLAWTTPTFLRLVFGHKIFIPGKFYLGTFFSPLIEWISVIFGAYTIVMVMFPASIHVDKNTMNYTCVITPAVLILSYIYYMVYSRKFYHGPCKTIDVEDQMELLDGIERDEDVDTSVVEKN
ncbi:UGA4 GABA-specific permease [Candida maltosa Xu316]|uniref:GABA-specific permease n=1 Tax=Candida maltosa (strain Xu316) TaxID=1245528 RepID=M3IN83_CANMX|nr:hypothetical protein G210_1680 [Candida maltosa Xu316]